MHWDAPMKKGKSPAPMEFIFRRQMKTISKIISDGGKCGENYNGDDMINTDWGRYLPYTG